MADANLNTYAGSTEVVQYYNEYTRNILVDLPIITDSVLTLLPARMLNTAAQVCRNWADSARRVRRCRRVRVNYFLGQVSSRCLQVSSDLHATVVEFCYSFLHQLSLEPKYIFLFCTDNIIEGKGAPYPPIKGGSQNDKRRKVKFVKYMYKLLPRNCVVVGAAASGIVGTENSSFKTLELDMDDAAYSLLSLPEIPGFKVVHYM